MSSTIRVAAIGAVAALVVHAGAAAQERPSPADNLDLTMVLLPENAVGPEEVTRRIELPPAAAPAERGRDRQPSGTGNGRETAEEARERGRDFGREVSEKARENREDVNRGNGPPESPGPPQAGPGTPGRPDNPGPPVDRPGPPSANP
jgi:hypothetical protein